MEKLAANDILHETLSLIHGPDDAIVGALRSHDTFNRMQVDVLGPPGKDIHRSIILYSATPRFTNQEAVTLEGLDLQQMYPWGKVEAILGETRGNGGGDGGMGRLLLMKGAALYYAAAEGSYESVPAFRLNLLAPQWPEEAKLMGTPQKFTVVNRANEGVAIGRVKWSKADSLVWNEISLTKGADAALVAVLATAVPLLKDRIGFEAGKPIGYESR